jgi:hypothetical protein
MTDTDKLLALSELLANVIHTLDMKQYVVEDATESHNCEVEADNYHADMLRILYPNP